MSVTALTHRSAVLIKSNPVIVSSPIRHHSDDGGSDDSSAWSLTLSVVNRVVLSVHKASVSWGEGQAEVRCPAAAAQEQQDLHKTSQTIEPLKCSFEPFKESQLMS